MNKFMKKTFVLVGFTIALAFLFSPKKTFADFTPPEVEMSIIQDYTIPIEKVRTIQPAPLTTVNILNFVEKTKTRTTTDLLRTIYPSYSTAQLQNVTANLNQCATYTKSLGYKTKVTNGPLDYATLKNEIVNNRPVLGYLTANGNYWIEQETAIIIYGVQRIKYAGQPENLIYLYRSLNHGDNALFSGQLNNIQLLINESIIDPSANVTYSWTNTLHGFTK